MSLAKKAEEFSFALAVVLTPAVIVKELYRLLHAENFQNIYLAQLLLPSMFGMLFSFIAGLVALKWLSSWLEHGRWHFFWYLLSDFLWCRFTHWLNLGFQTLTFQYVTLNLSVQSRVKY